MEINSGDCFLVDMNPPRKSKPGKVRPVVVIQATDTIQAGSPGIVVVPLTTKLMSENIIRVSLKPSPKLAIKQPSDILLDQIHTIDRSLFIEKLGCVDDKIFLQIQDGVKFILGF